MQALLKNKCKWISDALLDLEGIQVHHFHRYICSSLSFYFYFSRYHSGVRESRICSSVDILSSLMKSNRSGNGEPFGRVVFSSRNSSKYVCSMASNGLSLLSGLYTRIFEIRSIASRFVLYLKSLCQGLALIWGNLNSE